MAGWHGDGWGPVSPPLPLVLGERVSKRVFFWWGNHFFFKNEMNVFSIHTFSKLEVFGLRVFGKNATQYVFFFVLESFLAGEKRKFETPTVKTAMKDEDSFVFFRYLGEK